MIAAEKLVSQVNVVVVVDVTIVAAFYLFKGLANQAIVVAVVVIVDGIKIIVFV
jgi:hypothetical protein